MLIDFKLYILAVGEKVSLDLKPYIVIVNINASLDPRLYCDSK